MPNIQIEAGTLIASATSREVTGLLVPYGEEGATNLGKLTIPRGVLEVPQDLTGCSLNIDHDREQPVGALIATADTDEGLLATFRIAKTPAGDRALAEIRNPKGKRRRLSVEAAGIKIRNGIAEAGRVFAGALVERGAFPSATLMAAAADVDESAAGSEDTTTHEISEYTDENGVTWRRVVDTVTVEAGDTSSTTTTIVEEVTDPTATTEEDEEEPMTASTTLAAKAGVRKNTTATPRPQHDLGTIYASIAAARTGDPAATQLLAALTEVKTSGPLGKVGTTGSLPENWMGQVWAGRTYDRKIITLGTLGTDITATGKRGYKTKRGTKAQPLDRFNGDWDGDLSAIHTGIGYTDEIKSALNRFAIGNTLAREFTDLPGGVEIVEAYMKLIAEDYAMWSDDKALAAFVKAAGAPIAPKPVPARYADTPSLGMLIQGILAVQRQKDTPSFAIVNATAYEELIYTPKDLLPEFVTFDFSTELRGTADAGKVAIVEVSDEAFVDADGVPLIEAGEPAALVGAKQAMQFDELGATPITVDALEIAKGGIDRAVHGYLQTFEARAESIALVGTAHTP